MEEFKLGRKKYELCDVLPFANEFCTDQHGSRFIQLKMESASYHDIADLFDSIRQSIDNLTTDVFGNYVVQKMFEYGNDATKTQLYTILQGKIFDLSVSMYGCRVVQKSLDHISPPLKSKLIRELKGHVLDLVKDQNGNHVIQKAIECCQSNEDVIFFLDAFKGCLNTMAMHPYGCRVVQRLFEFMPKESLKGVFEELILGVVGLIQDQYGNYVIQHLLDQGSSLEIQCKLHMSIHHLTIHLLIYLSTHPPSIHLSLIHSPISTSCDVMTCNDSHYCIY